MIGQFLKIVEDNTDITLVDREEAMIGRATPYEWLDGIKSGDAIISGKEQILWVDFADDTICIDTVASDLMYEG